MWRHKHLPPPAQTHTLGPRRTYPPASERMIQLATPITCVYLPLARVAKTFSLHNTLRANQHHWNTSAYLLILGLHVWNITVQTQTGTEISILQRGQNESETRVSEALPGRGGGW